MNFLSHLYLAEDSEESMIGNLLGDFVKGRLGDNYPNEILKGIKTHRKVDFYTETHQVVKEARNLISPDRRRYAGVLVDIFFDHFLTVHWDNYSDIKIDDFINKAYDVMLKYREIYPENGKVFIPRIVEMDWLRQYESFDGLKLVFERMSHRVKRENPLSGSEVELMSNYSTLGEKFDIFFPELIKYVEEIRLEL